MAVETLVPERYRPAHRQHRLSFAAEARSRPMGSGLETLLCRRDGSEVPVDIALRPSGWDRPGQVVAAVRDASGRKQLEQALWHSEQRLGLLVDSVADYAIFLLDPQGPVVSWNEGRSGSRAGGARESWRAPLAVLPARRGDRRGADPDPGGGQARGPVRGRELAGTQ